MAVLAVSILGFWAFPKLLKKLDCYNVLAIASVQNLIFCILWSCYWYGGVNSPTLPWVLTIPLLAFFYIGPSSFLRTVVITLFGVNVLIFLGLAIIAPPAPNDIPSAHMESLGIISTIAVSLYVTMMAIYYAKVYESQTELEAEMREHLQTALELRRATEDAENAGAAKAEFLAKMSHELRTPLNAVINYSEMLLEEAQSEDDKDAISDLNKIHAAGHHLLKLINEVLDLSKIDAGMMGLFNEEANFRDLLRASVDEFRSEAQLRGNVFNVDIEAGVEIVTMDRQKAGQVLSQVIDNAVKFTRNGLINIHVSRRINDSRDMISVAVRDTGIGIAEHELPTLFQQFTVLGDASSSKYGGTGLGLALSQKLCRLMGGDLKAHSVLGEGSCFTIFLPVSHHKTRDAVNGSVDGTGPGKESPEQILAAA